MDTYEKIIRKHSWRFPKGYPDLNNPKDKEFLISIVEGYLKEDENSELQQFIKDEGLENIDPEIQKMIFDIKKKTEKSSVTRYKQSIGDKKNVFRKVAADKGLDTKSKATALNIFTRDTDGSTDVDEVGLDEFATYMKNPLKYSDLGTSGVIWDKFKGRGISEDRLRELLRQDGIIKSTAVGPGELFLVLLMDDVAKAKKGDLEVRDTDGDGKADTGFVNAGGREVEVKAQSAQLSPYGRQDDLIPLFGAATAAKKERGGIRAELEKYYDKEFVDDHMTKNGLRSGNAPGSKLGNIISTANNLPEGEGKIKFIAYLKEMLKKLYTKGNYNNDENIEKHFSRDSIDKNEFLTDTAKKLAKDYVEKEKINDFLLLNHKNGAYLNLSAKQLLDNIGIGDGYLVKIGGYSDVSPRLSLNVNKILGENV